MPIKRTHWLKLFPGDERKFSIWEKVKRQIEAKIENQKQGEAQKIGKIREEKVKEALEELKLKQEIRDFRPTGGLSFHDLIRGVDFICVFIDGSYKACHFSVTGKDWVQKHLLRHPEVPVLVIDLYESRKSIEEKILALKAEFLKK